MLKYTEIKCSCLEPTSFCYVLCGHSCVQTVTLGATQTGDQWTSDKCGHKDKTLAKTYKMSSQAWQ